MPSSDWKVARWMLIIRPAVVTATLGAAMVVVPANIIDKNPITAVLIGTYILTLLYWLAHYVTGVSRLLLAAEIAFDIFIITFIIHFTGGHESFFIGFYFLSIMCASLFFRRRITFLFSLQAALFFIADLVLEIQEQNIPDDMFGTIILSTSLYVLLMFSIALLSSYYAEKVRGKDNALLQALKLLKEAKLDTSDILQSMTNGLITVDTNGRIIYMNRVAESILHVERRVTVGRPYSKVFDKRASQLVALFDKHIKHTHDFNEQEIELANDDGSFVPLGLKSMPLYDTDGSRRGTIVNFKDLTEKNQLLEMLRQSERMAAIGQLSAAIAHEIRNPLASLYSAVELLTEQIVSDRPQVSRLLNVVEKESNRLQKISSDFLHFARMNNPEIQPVNLKKSIDDAILFIENDPRKTAEITISNTVETSSVILFDHDQLTQLLLNVVINSLQAMDGIGAIDLTLANKQSDSAPYIRLMIRDNGPGFPREAIGSMFEPFFSTKKEGTGLGLALVRKITVSNGGRVSARNNDNGGAEIILDLLKA